VWLKRSVSCFVRESNPIKLKGQFNKTIRRTKLYSIECEESNRKTIQRISVADMKILRLIRQITKEDMINKEYIRGNIGASSIIDKMRRYN